MEISALRLAASALVKADVHHRRIGADFLGRVIEAFAAVQKGLGAFCGFFVGDEDLAQSAFFGRHIFAFSFGVGSLDVLFTDLDVLGDNVVLQHHGG